MTLKFTATFLEKNLRLRSAQFYMRSSEETIYVTHREEILNMLDNFPHQEAVQNLAYGAPCSSLLSPLQYSKVF